PSRGLSGGAYGPTARAVLERLADESGLEMGVADEVVVLGPVPAAERAATEMMAAWDRLVASTPPSPPTAPSRFITSHPIRWPTLTTPAEALRIVADSWDL